jgi:glutamate formiminotransferase
MSVDGPIIECVANYSEGRRVEVVSAIAETIAGVEGVKILDVESDVDHNRSVITFAGGPEAVGEAAIRSVGTAADWIDLNRHEGVHPRIGAADVIPFVPLRRATVTECEWVAHHAGEEIWKRYGVPAYLYGDAAQLPHRRSLPNVRRGGFEVLRRVVKTDLSRHPDFGEADLHPTAGAVAVGARRVLIAWNIQLASEDLEKAEWIAENVRESGRGLTGVRALGLPLASKGMTQVSMNLTNYEVTPPHVVMQKVEMLAKVAGVEISGSELIGLIPRAALELAEEAEVDLRIENAERGITIEERLEAAGL